MVEQLEGWCGVGGAGGVVCEAEVRGSRCTSRPVDSGGEGGWRFHPPQERHWYENPRLMIQSISLMPEVWAASYKQVLV